MVVLFVTASISITIKTNLQLSADANPTEYAPNARDLTTITYTRRSK